MRGPRLGGSRVRGGGRSGRRLPGQLKRDASGRGATSASAETPGALGPRPLEADPPQTPPPGRGSPATLPVTGLSGHFPEWGSRSRAGPDPRLVFLALPSRGGSFFPLPPLKPRRPRPGRSHPPAQRGDGGTHPREGRGWRGASFWPLVSGAHCDRRRPGAGTPSTLPAGAGWGGPAGGGLPRARWAGLSQGVPTGRGPPPAAVLGCGREAPP